jgi:dTDP-4-amino-4,6-dideoxygalactose transaminase
MRSICFHGKGDNKYVNIRIGRNSRLDTIQAAILLVKLRAFIEYELDAVNKVAKRYNELLRGRVEIPFIPDGYYSSWAQYTIKLKSSEERSVVMDRLNKKNIPTMIYYPILMHEQEVFKESVYSDDAFPTAMSLKHRVLSIPMSADMIDSLNDDIFDNCF